MNITTTLTQKGQITIPKIFRDLLELSPADNLVISLEEEKIVATPVKSDILSLYGSVKYTGKPVDLEKLRRQTIKSMAENTASEGK